jgi:hypothetical protein
METSTENIRETFFRQAETCQRSSLLYHDMLIIFGHEKAVVKFIQDIIVRRSFTGIIEALLTFLAFFHYQTLKNSEGFSQLKKYFKTQGGDYRQEDYYSLAKVLMELWQTSYKSLEDWMLNTKLQTNEIARCSVVYPAILSLGLEKINLIELGCSAGLMLLMDLYSYEYFNELEVFNINKQKPVLKCKTFSQKKLKAIFQNKTEIIKKIGIDLFPIDLSVADNVVMLKATLWDDVERSERLSQALELFNSPPKSPSLPALKPEEARNEVKGQGGELNLLALDYTEDLIKPLESLIDKSSDIVFYCSVSTYQISMEAYQQLLERLKELAEHLQKDIYFIEFEELKKGQVKNITREEPFHLTIYTFPSGKNVEFGRAHFHGNSLTIF